MELINRRLEDSVPRGLEVTSGYNLKGITDVDDQSTGLVRDVVPLLISAPDLETRDRYREQQSRQAEVCVTMHPQALTGFLSLLLHRTE